MGEEMKNKCIECKCNDCTKLLNEQVIKHRAKNIINCPETCFCWDIMTLINARQKIIDGWHEEGICSGCDQCNDG